MRPDKIKITSFLNAKDTINPIYTDAQKVFNRIKEPHKDTREIIEEIRSCADPDKKIELKKKLPCVLWVGEFRTKVRVEKDGKQYDSYRTDQSLTVHSGLVPIDIDCESKEDADMIFDTLCADDTFYALWRSPSGDGIHGLVKIADGSKHRKHYAALLLKYPFLDSTSRNESRFLYMSYDPNIYINENSHTFYEIAEEVEYTIISVNNPDYFVDYNKLNIACKMVRLAPDGKKHETLLKAANLMGGCISVGKMDEQIAIDCLFHEISQRKVADLSLAKQTIIDGIRHGKGKPILESEYELKQEEEKVKATEMDLSFLANDGLDDEFITKFHAGLIPMGKSFGYSEWDNHLLLKEGEFYVTLAAGHAGKTTFSLWLCFLSAILHKWNFMVYTGENRSAEVKIVLMQFYVGKKIRDFTHEELRLAKKFVKEYFDFVSTDHLYSYMELVEFADKLTSYKSVKGVLVDPYNSLRSDLSNQKNKHIYDYEAFSEFLTFTKRSGSSLFLNVHTGTAHQREKDKDGNPMMPTASQMEGGSFGMNRSDNFICLNRKIKSPDEWMFTEISVDKVRNGLTGGKPTLKSSPLRLKYNKGVEFLSEYGELPFSRNYLYI